MNAGPLAMHAWLFGRRVVEMNLNDICFDFDDGGKKTILNTYLTNWHRMTNKSIHFSNHNLIKMIRNQLADNKKLLTRPV